MGQQIINVGPAPNDGLGDPIRTAYIKCNNNFDQLFSRAQETPPSTLVGSVGDTAGMYAYDSTYFYYCYANYDGSNVIWAQLTQVGNISIPTIVNGTSNVNIGSSNGNITVSVNGLPNVVVFTQNAANFSVPVNSTQSITSSQDIVAAGNVTGGNLVALGSVSATGNVSGTFFIGNGALLTGIATGNGGGGGGGNSIVNGLSSVSIPNTSGNVLVSVGLFGTVGTFSSQGLSSSANVTAAQLISNTTLTVSQTATVGNLTTGGHVSAAGNITGSGSASVSGNITGGNIVTAGQITALGNVTGDYIIGNGAFLTGITSGGGTNYTDANVAAYLPTYTGNLGGTLTTASQPGITQVGVLSGLIVDGLQAVAISPTGNSVTVAPTFGGAIILNSSGLGSINNMTIGNSTPAAATFTNLSVTGNITGSNFAIGGNISTTGNITGQYLIGDGSFITNIGVGSTYGNANVAAYLPTYTGNITAGNIAVTNHQTIGGNLTVNNVNAQSNVNVVNTVNTNKVIGQLTGTVNGVNTTYGIWDFGSISGTIFESPIAWIFAQTAAGNVDMGTISAPSSNDIDIGTIY